MRWVRREALYKFMRLVLGVKECVAEKDPGIEAGVDCSFSCLCLCVFGKVVLRRGGAAEGVRDTTQTCKRVTMMQYKERGESNRLSGKKRKEGMAQPKQSSHQRRTNE